MASTWQSIVSSPTFSNFPSEKQNAVRRDYFEKHTTPEDLQIELERLSTLHGVDPSFSKAIASIESNWDAKAKSPKGATGIMQLMPPTAGDRAREMKLDVKEVLSNPSFNMEAGVRHLKYLLKRYDGDIKKAAQAYNWGEGNLEKKGELAAPKETRDYLAKLEKKIGRVPTTADVPYGSGIVGKRIVRPVEGEEDLEQIRDIDPNIFKKENEPTISLTYKNTEKEVGEVPFIRGENEDNTFDIAVKPTISRIEEEEKVGPPIPRNIDIPHPYEFKNPIPSPLDVGKRFLGDVAEGGQKTLGRGIKLLTGMNPVSAIPGNLIGQYIENPNQYPSLVEAVGSELVSLIPGGSGLVKGGLTGLAQSVISSLAQEGKLPELEDALSSGMLGSFLGKFLSTIKEEKGGRHLQLEDKRPPQSPLQIDDTRPIGQSLTTHEGRYVAPIEGKSTSYPQESSPTIPELQAQSKKIKLLSKGHEFGVNKILEEETPTIPRILPPKIPSILLQNRDKIEALRKDPTVPSFPKSENTTIQARRDRLDEILSQYEANLKSGSARILPPGPPSHLSQIKKDIEDMKNKGEYVPSSTVGQIPSPPSIPLEKGPPMKKEPPSQNVVPRGKPRAIPKVNKEEALNVYRKKLQEKSPIPSSPEQIKSSLTIPKVVDYTYIRDFVKQEDFQKYLEAASIQREGVQAYQLAAERLLTKQGYPKEFISKVKSKMYELSK